MILEYIISKVLDGAIDKAKLFIEDKSRLVVSKEQIEESLKLHISSIKNWCQNITFRDLAKAKSIEDIFIDLDLSLIPKRLQITDEEKKDSSRIIKNLDVFDYSDNHIVLLGHAGAGKTTTLKRICHLLLFDKNFHTDKFNFPIVIRLNELNTSEESSLFKKIYMEIGLVIKFDEKLDQIEIDDIIEKIVLSYLEHSKALLLLDGFDEIYSADIKANVIAELHKLFLKLNNARIVVTSRTSDFPYNLDNSSVFEICALTESQITAFVQKWFKNSNKSNRFMKEIKKSPFFDATIRPLNLAHLCAIFERINKIPDKPKTVYRKIVNLLLEEWDSQKGVTRVTRYSKFETDRKSEFLANLAFELTIKQKATSFKRAVLEEVYSSIYENFGLPSNEITEVIDELETHNGIFVQSGYETYEFSHKSIQEYLTAEFLVRLPTIPEIPILLQIPNELAVAVAISSNPTIYLSIIVLERFAELNKFVIDDKYDEELLRKVEMLERYGKIEKLNKYGEAGLLRRLHELAEKEYPVFFDSFLYRLIYEKPDFIVSPITAVIFLYLYTIYQNDQYYNEGRKTIFKSTAIDYIEHFLNDVNVLLSFDKLSKFYSVSEDMHNGDSDSNLDIKLHKIREVEGLLIKAPSYLYAKRGFLRANSMA